MPEAEPNFEAILQVLVDHEVDFIVVGGVSAVLHGAPVHTFDLDVVHSRAPENLDRLLAALRVLDAYYREQPSRRLRPDRSHLISAGHQLLMTRYGPLDLLGTVTGNRGYEDLVGHTVDQPLEAGQRIQLLDLPTLILLKEETGREKDKAVLPLLRRTLEEKTRE
jgi:hypothetical protein